METNNQSPNTQQENPNVIMQSNDAERKSENSQVEMKEDNISDKQESKQENTQVDVKSLSAELATLRKQNRELLNEKKNAQKSAEEAEMEKAKASGEYKKWAETAEKSAKEWETKYNEKMAELKNKEIENTALSIASELGANEKAKPLLKKLIKESLTSLADENGIISKEDLESFKREVKNGEDYAPLVAGNKSSGSGAPGAGSCASGVKEMSMAEWQRLSPEEQVNFSNLSRAGKANII